MSETKFTKGPWVAVPHQFRMQCCDSRPIFDNGMWGIFPTADMERLPIGVVDKGNDHHEPTRDQAKYDAAVMACAPDMYTMLERIREGLADREDLAVSIDDLLARARGEGL